MAVYLAVTYMVQHKVQKPQPEIQSERIIISFLLDWVVVVHLCIVVYCHILAKTAPTDLSAMDSQQLSPPPTSTPLNSFMDSLIQGKGEVVLVCDDAKLLIATKPKCVQRRKSNRLNYRWESSGCECQWCGGGGVEDDGELPCWQAE